MMKNYKILFGIVALMSLGLVSCDPLEDEIDQINSEATVSKEIEITLSDDDYDLLEEFEVAEYGNFESEEEAREYIPYILSELYPQLGQGSAALVHYNLYRGNFVNSRTLSSGDYESADEDIEAPFFNNDFPAENYLATLAESRNSNPADGQVQIFKYAYADVAYSAIEGFDLFSEDFSDLEDLSTYTTFSAEGADQTWELYESSSGYTAARMSAFADGSNVPNTDWLILPEIDLSGNSQAVLNISHVLNFLGAGVIGTDVDVRVSTDYSGSGNPDAATWTSLSLDAWPSGDSYDIVSSQASLAAYADQSIYIAFYYHSTANFGPQWRVVDVDVKSVDVDMINVYYQYSLTDGEWQEVDTDDFYMVTESDYEAMGVDGNFTSSVSVDDYLPTLLSNEYPYAQEEDEIIVIYDYYSSSADEVQKRGNIYTYLEGEWSGYQSEVEISLQFGFDDGSWVPDNTIRYTFTGDDYALAGDEANGLGNAAARDNIRSYGNFGTQWSHEEIVDVIDFVLRYNFPDNEVGQQYLVTYNTYPGGDVTTRVILTDAGTYEEVE